jgi:hypothetical protein
VVLTPASRYGRACANGGAASFLIERSRIARRKQEVNPLLLDRIDRPSNNLIMYVK